MHHSDLMKLGGKTPALANSEPANGSHSPLTSGHNLGVSEGRSLELLSLPTKFLRGDVARRMVSNIITSAPLAAVSPCLAPALCPRPWRLGHDPFPWCAHSTLTSSQDPVKDLTRGVRGFLSLLRQWLKVRGRAASGRCGRGPSRRTEG